jgi:hypothetical protein
MKGEVGAGLQTTFFGDKLFRDFHMAITKVTCNTLPLT